MEGAVATSGKPDTSESFGNEHVRLSVKRVQEFIQYWARHVQSKRRDDKVAAGWIPRVESYRPQINRKTTKRSGHDEVELDMVIERRKDCSSRRTHIEISRLPGVESVIRVRSSAASQPPSQCERSKEIKKYCENKGLMSSSYEVIEMQGAG
jgi:hypothetical protein